jgi:hypothetical protein
LIYNVSGFSIKSKNEQILSDLYSETCLEGTGGDDFVINELEIGTQHVSKSIFEDF